MLLEFFEYLSNYYSGFSVFQYITLRSILSALTAIVISFLIGPIVIEKLALRKVGEVIREEGPESHYNKAGTPTMGGMLILISVLTGTLLWTDLSNRYIYIVLFVMVSFAILGGFDDYKKIKLNSKGMAAITKFFWQSAISFVAVYILYKTAQTTPETQLIIPFWKSIVVDLGVWFIPLSYLVIVATSNAVNITDGLDGLAIMPAILISGALAIFAYASGNINFSHYLAIPYLPLAGELVVFCSSLVGAGLGFLWFNTYPAQIFMGNLGALSIGAAIGVIAGLVRQEIVLIIMGGVFVVETLSVIGQVVSYKLTGKRIFLMAPLHHHFELKGWPEPRVIVRFWIITVILVLVSLATLKVR